MGIQTLGLIFLIKVGSRINWKIDINIHILCGVKFCN